MAKSLKDVGVLFDLDGTLLDTSPDLLHALDKALHQHGLPACDHFEIKNFINDGSEAIVRQAVQKTLDPETSKQIQNDLLAEYARIIGRETHYFVGMDILLEWLDIENIPWGVVTNKGRVYPSTNEATRFG